MIRIAVIMGKMDPGGKKNLVMEYYRHIDRTKIQFDFICDADSRSIPDEEIRDLGGEVYRITPYQNLIGNMRDIYRLCKKNRYPIMHAYNSTMNIFPMFVAKISGVPVRINESLSMAHKEDKKTILKKFLRMFSKRFSDHYMSCGELCGRWQFGDKLFDAGKVTVFKTVINTRSNSYDPALREKTRILYGWEEKIVIGHIGRLTAQKNPIRVIEIFAAILAKESRAILCLIGDGELKAATMKRIKKLGVERQVCYLGRREDIRKFYNAMDAFLLPSLYEGLPVVGLEAESCGLPIFFSTEIAEEANACELGHFLKLDETDEFWAEEILKAVKRNMPIRRDHAREVAEAGFDSSYEAKRLQEYYIKAFRKVGGQSDQCDSAGL